MEERSLALIDLIGFSNMVKADSRKAADVLDDFYNIAFEIIKPCGDIEGHLFSDTLLAYSSDEALLVNKVCEVYRRCFMKNKEYNEKNFFLLLRGGISRGHIDIRKRTEAPNLKKNFIVSPALVHSAEMEEKIKGSRLLIAYKTGSPHAEQLHWNSQIEPILHKTEFYEFWKDYQYVDCLWFSGGNATKQNVEELISEAANFVESNKKTQFLSSYVNTLRIGLLSYSRFYEAPTSEKFVSELLKRFKDEEYWEIWLAFFEFAMNSPDSWAVPARKDFVGFYKKVCLSDGWGQLRKKVNSPENVHIKKELEEFVHEMKIRTI